MSVNSVHKGQLLLFTQNARHSPLYFSTVKTGQAEIVLKFCFRPLACHLTINKSFREAEKMKLTDTQKSEAFQDFLSRASNVHPICK